MYAKTCALAVVAIWLVSACLADPAAEANPSPKAWWGGCGCDPCTVHRCHTFPIHSAVGIHTTHRIIPSNTCGYYGGWAGHGGWGGWGGHGGWGGWGGHGGWGGCGGWGGHGGWGGYGHGWGNGCGCW